MSGLSKGSTVEFNGIKVGEVAQLQLDPEDPRRVRARIQVDASAPMRTDTRARLVPAVRTAQCGTGGALLQNDVQRRG